MDAHVEGFAPDDAVPDLDARVNPGETASEPVVGPVEERETLTRFFANFQIRCLIDRDHVEGVFHDDLVVTSAGGTFALPRTPTSPTGHEALGILPGAFAHLNGVDVGKQSLGAPAEEILLELDECGSGEEDGREEGCNQDGDRLAEIATAHGWVDTASGRRVPGDGRRKGVLWMERHGWF